MRRSVAGLFVALLALALSLGLAFPSGAAKAGPTTSAAMTYDVGAPVPSASFPGNCDVTITWDAVPAAPKGYSLHSVAVAYSMTPVTDWHQLFGYELADPAAKSHLLSVANSSYGAFNVAARCVTKAKKASEMTVWSSPAIAEPVTC